MTPTGVVSTFASASAGPLTVGPRRRLANPYVGNTGTNTVSKVTPAAVVSTFASGINNPSGLAFDAAGNLYVSNFSANTVSKVTPAGAVSTFASGFNQPYGLAVDAAGNLYVANQSTGNTVSKISGPVGVPFTLGGTNVSRHRLQRGQHPARCYIPSWADQRQPSRARCYSDPGPARR